MLNVYLIQDNFYSSSEIIVSSNYSEINPDNLPGIYNVILTAIDPRGNETIEEFSLEVKLVYFYIIENLNLLENGISSIWYDETGPTADILTCWIYFYKWDIININENNGFWFIKSFRDDYYGNIFFNGSFNRITNTSLSIAIRQGGSESSWLRLQNFDATIDYNELNLSQASFTNDGEIDNVLALEYFNEYALYALNQVKFIYEEVFGLDFEYLT